MILHRALDLSSLPPGPHGTEQSRFSASWSQTLAALEREAVHLSGQGRPEVYIEVDLPPSAIRLDGGIRANARPPASHVVAVSVPHVDLGDLRLVSGRYKGAGSYGFLPGWQANVRAVVLTLEALRAIDRWGAATGEQYRGFAALGAGGPAVTMGAGLTVEQASRLLADAAGFDLGPGQTMTADDARWAYRLAARRCHPDRGGDPDLFRRLTEARDLLLGR